MAVFRRTESDVTLTDPRVTELLRAARAQLELVDAAAHGDPRLMMRISEAEDVDVHLALRRLTVEVAHLHNSVAALLEIVELREQG